MVKHREQNSWRYWGLALMLVIILIPAFSAAQYAIKDIGGFESDLPSYWNKGSEPDGATLTWATDQYRTLGRSLKISKGVTSEAAYWISDNMCDQWAPTHPADKDLLLGAFVMTENVNTNPTTEDEKWYLKWEFWDSLGAVIGESIVPIDQSVASNGAFVADTNETGSAILPRASYTTIVSFVGGKDATGTVWVDNLITADERGAQWSWIWNDTFICPKGWFYWLPSTDGLVSHGYENTRLTDEEAHTGLYSLKFDLPFDRQQQDAFIGAKRVWLDQSKNNPKVSAAQSDVWTTLNAQPGDKIRISVWIKASNLVPDSAAAYPEPWSFGFTPIFFASAENNAGFDPQNELKAYDMHFKFPHVTEFDWTEYYLDIKIPEPPEVTNEMKAMSVRIHPYSRVTGMVYFDDLTVKVLGKATDVDDSGNDLPFKFELANNYPNPFNPTTTISYSIPKADRVTLQIFNVLGQRVRTLVNIEQAAGRYQVQWNGKDEMGNAVGSGVYFYQLNTSRQVTVKKMVLIK